MSDASASPPPTPPLSEPSSGPGEWRTLRRSRSDRYVAGVLGGLARRLDIDPLILRIATVVLAMFGIGVLLYALGWLLIPAEDEDASVAEQAFGRGRASGGRSDAVLLTIGLGLLILISAGGILGGWGEGLILLVLAVCGIALLLRRDDHREAVPATDAHTSESAPEAAPMAEPHSTETTATWAEGPDWEPDRPWEDDQQAWDPFAEAEPATSQPQRSRSSLWLTTVSTAAIALGVVAINDAIWATVAPATYIATALGIVGLGLLIGAWFGRSRGLIVLGLVLSLALVPAVIHDQVGFRGERVEVSPTTVAGIPSGTQEYHVGDVRYDLSAVDFPENDPISLSIEQGVGELTVVLPRDVDVSVNADLGVGEIQVLDDVSGGFGREVRVRDAGSDGRGGGELELRVEMGVGRIEVDRAAA